LPNVVIIGRSSLGICDEISAIVRQLGIDGENAVITYSPELCCIDMTKQHRDSPYLIVRDTDETRARTIGTALNARLNMDTEVQLLADFLPKRE